MVLGQEVNEVSCQIYYSLQTQLFPVQQKLIEMIEAC